MQIEAFLGPFYPSLLVIRPDSSLTFRRWFMRPSRARILEPNWELTWGPSINNPGLWGIQCQQAGEKETNNMSIRKSGKGWAVRYSVLNVACFLVQKGCEAHKISAVAKWGGQHQKVHFSTAASFCLSWQSLWIFVSDYQKRRSTQHVKLKLHWPIPALFLSHHHNLHQFLVPWTVQVLWVLLSKVSYLEDGQLVRQLYWSPHAPRSIIFFDSFTHQSVIEINLRVCDILHL